jgi:hypothetical protein
MATRISLNDLKQRMAFVGAPVLKTVKYTHDDEELEFDVYIRKLSYQSAMNDSDSFKDKPNSFVAGRIASCVLDEQAKPLFESVDQILGIGDYAESGALNDRLTFALFSAVTEVNSTGKSKSTDSTNSGANSSSTESVETPLNPQNDESA